MILGSQIRRARRALGWSQKELAHHTGYSQAYISMLERAEVAPPEALQRVAVALGLKELPSPEVVDDQQALLPLPDVDDPTGLPLRISSWRRPSVGGDMVTVMSAGRQGKVVAALDVAGHGARAYAAALYLRGWLRGRCSQGASVPRVEDLASGLSREMESAGIEAAFYIAILRKEAEGQNMAYEAASMGYPPPLLLVGNTARAIESVSAHGSIVQMLPPPWRLVIASDGLLSRLGGGNEQEGRRLLLSWQRGPDRDQAPEARLQTRAPWVDDESFLRIVWDGWDMELFVDALSPAEHDRILRLLLERVTASSGRDAALRLVAAAHEALVNARVYAGVHGVRVALRLLPEVATLEVTDHGVGLSQQAQQTKGRGLSVMRAQCDHVEFRRPETGGTIATLVVRKR